MFAGLARKLKAAGLGCDDRILDYGCGNGRFVQYLRERGYSSVRGYDRFAPGYTSPAALQETYDAVLAMDVLEHVEDPRATLLGWRGLLRDGGFLFLSLPNALGLDLAKPGRAIHDLHQPYHLHIPTPEALTRMAKDAGFEAPRIEERSYFDTLIPTVNRAFCIHALRAADDTVDAGYESPRVFRIMSSPRLWFYALCGYFFPGRNNMVAVFRAAEAVSDEG